MIMNPHKITEIELIDLAKRISPSFYEGFGSNLGFCETELENLSSRFDKQEATRTVLRRWTERRHRDENSREVLADILANTGMKEIGDLLRIDSMRLHDAEGPSHPLTYHDKWKNRTVRPAKSGPDESDREMQYVMWETLVKGNALIIGNADFTVCPRSWAYMDIVRMKGLLKKLGYDSIDIHKDLSEMGMRGTVEKFTEQLKKDNPQSAVVYISSHGSEKGIAGCDGGILQIRDMLEMFSRVLPGKPKVLIVDACWGDDETSRLPVAASSSSSSSSGAPTTNVLPENADIFMIHSTSYGKKAWSCTKEGSWLVDELCEVVYSNDRDLEDLDTIMLRVTKGVRKIKRDDADGNDVGTQSTTVFKQGVDRKLFFYPGFPPTNV